MKYLLIALMVLTLFQPLHAATVFTYRAPESAEDTRHDYDTEVLELALEKTRGEYGDYKMVPSPAMNARRAVSYLKTNKLENLILKHSYDKRLNTGELTFAAFPVELGIVGYRVCFVAEQLKEDVGRIGTIEELNKYTHGQGLGWSDVEILRRNGMDVVEVVRYESLFKMVALNRFDLFCRGVNEFQDEYGANSHIPNLAYDESFAIAYPLPRFFYGNSGNREAIERIEKGLIAAHRDGSLKKLWLKHYHESIEFAGLDRRKIIRLQNPQLEGLDPAYQKYLYDPFEP